MTVLLSAPTNPIPLIYHSCPTIETHLLLFTVSTTESLFKNQNLQFTYFSFFVAERVVNGPLSFKMEQRGGHLVYFSKQNKKESLLLPCCLTVVARKQKTKITNGLIWKVRKEQAKEGGKKHIFLRYSKRHE